jgi:hypothetical protein
VKRRATRRWLKVRLPKGGSARVPRRERRRRARMISVLHCPAPARMAGTEARSMTLRRGMVARSARRAVRRVASIAKTAPSSPAPPPSRELGRT